MTIRMFEIIVVSPDPTYGPMIMPTPFRMPGASCDTGFVALWWRDTLILRKRYAGASFVTGVFAYVLSSNDECSRAQ
jgi:hypothetical protein